MTVHIRSNGMTAVFHDGAWSIGGLTGTQVAIGGKKVLGSRGFAIANPSGGSVVDAEARSALNDVLTALREHGLIEI